MRIAYLKEIVIASVFIVFNMMVFQNCSKISSAFNSKSPENLSHVANQKYELSEILLSDATRSDIDTIAYNCEAPVLQGFKCLDRQVSTSEGKTYLVRIKWNRINQVSRGSFISVGGGSGKGEALDDLTFKKIVNKLDTIDQVRAIFIEFTDNPRASADWGGCWSQAGGYKSAGLLFREVIKLIVDDLRIPRGGFLNYLGLSNGTMLASYGMSNFDMDRYFNRVVLHAGPVMASASEACDVNNPKSISRLNTKDKADYLLKLFSQWLNGDAGPDMCESIKISDRMSVLGPKKNFPNTDIVTVIGALEDKPGGFGTYHIQSNEDWFSKISAKSKIRLVPEYMGHLYSYSNIRRFLKVGSNQMPDADEDCIDKVTEICEAGTLYKNVNLACTVSFTDYIMQGAGYTKVATDQYKISLNKSCNMQPAPVVTPQPAPVVCSTGQFNSSSGDIIAYKCNCPSTENYTGWNNVGGGCYHKVIQSAAVPALKPFQFTGGFYGDGSIITKRVHKITGGGANLKVCLGRYSVNANGCLSDSEFVLMKDRLGVGGSYDAAADIYSISEDLTAYRFPFEKYYTVFILSNGERRKIDLNPIYVSSNW